MEKTIVKQVVRLGNSSGVVLPKEWIGGTAKIELVRKPLNIKGDIFKLLDRYLSSVLGIYLVGSYSRGEQTKNSDVDIIVISDNLRKDIVSEEYNISIYPLKDVKRTIERNPLMIYPRILESKVLLNSSLIKEFSKKFGKKSFKRFIADTKSILRINKEIIKLDKIEGEFISSPQVIYSLILRLRGLFLVGCLLSNKRYYKKNFFSRFEAKIGKEDFEKLYEVYETFKKQEKIKTKIKIAIVEKLFSLVKGEIKKYV